MDWSEGAEAVDWADHGPGEFVLVRKRQHDRRLLYFADGAAVIVCL